MESTGLEDRMRLFCGKGFLRGEDDLEHELRANRPEPRRELVDGIAAMVGRQSRRGSGRRARAGVAVAISVALLAALGAVGQLSYAANGVTRAVSSAVHVIAPAKAHIVPASALSSAQAQYFVAVCFLGQTMNVSSAEVDAFVSNGAADHACKGGAFAPGQKQAWECVNGTNVRVLKSQAIDSDVAYFLSRVTLWNQHLQLDLARHDARAARIARIKVAQFRAKAAKAQHLKKLGITSGFCSKS
jgi:hypothetical protein